MRKILPLYCFLWMASLFLGCASSSHATEKALIPVKQDLLSQIAALEPHNFNPQLVIDGANVLLPLGKEAALDSISQFLTANPTFSSSFGLFVLLRSLFEVPEKGLHPPMYVGSPDIAPPSNPKLVPAFPILWVEYVPLSIVGGYMLGGKPEHVESHIQQYRQAGKLRGKPLLAGKKNGIAESAALIWETAYGTAIPDVVRDRINAQIAFLRD